MGLSLKQEKAIAALLSQPSVEKAAKAAGVASRTLYLWMREEEFDAQYRAARRRVVEEATWRLSQASGAAVDALVRNLTCGRPGVEVRAALGVVELALKAREQQEILERLEVLELRQAEAERLAEAGRLVQSARESPVIPGNGRRPCN